MGKNYSCNNVTGLRKASDAYYTPYSLTRLLLDQITLKGDILEPASGDGAIVKVLGERGYGEGEDAIRWYDLIADGTDFFDEFYMYDTIITNPPYSMAREFILKAKQIAKHQIIFLLPLNYLHGKDRYDTIWTDKAFPLKKVWVFTRYPMLGDELREDGKHRTGMTVYAWYVWEKGYVGEPTIGFLDNNSYVLSKKELDTK